MNSWHKTQDAEYLALQETRIANSENLTWVDQAVRLIEEEFLVNSRGQKGPTSVADYGCAAGHLAKGLQKTSLHFTYLGIDSSHEYLGIAAKYFPQHEFKKMDLTGSRELSTISTKNVAVISATLEHLENPFHVLRHLFQKTNRLILIRTFCGAHTLEDWVKKPTTDTPFLVRQFTLDELHLDPKWAMTVHIDEATRGDLYSLPEVEPNDVRRQMYFLSFRPKDMDSYVHA